LVKEVAMGAATVRQSGPFHAYPAEKHHQEGKSSKGQKMQPVKQQSRRTPGKEGAGPCQPGKMKKKGE
jgi:hypothetical protein